MSKIPKHLKSLVAKDVNVIVKYGDPGVGKTCFLTALYEYLYLSENWMVEHNVDGNYTKIKRIHEFLEEIKNNNQLPVSTTAGEIHELDLLLTPDNIHQSNIKPGKGKLFTFLDLAGEDCLHFKDYGNIKGPIKEYLIGKLDTTLLYLVRYEDGPEKDKEVALIMDHLRTKKSHHFDRFGLIVTHWDKNVDINGNKKFPNIEKYLKENMPGAFKKLKFLRKFKVETKAFPFSIGNIVEDEFGKMVLENGLDLSNCGEIAHWLYYAKAKKYFWLPNRITQETWDDFEKNIERVWRFVGA